MKKMILLFMVLLLLKTDGPLYAETYNRILEIEPLTLDPATAVDASAAHILIQIGEGLVTYDLNSIVPAVAEKWEISKDLKVYTFYIRPNARFSDGSQIVSDDAIETLKNVVLSKDEGSMSVLNIVGTKDFLAKKSSSLSGIEKISDKVFKVTLENPFSPFLDVLTASYFPIFPKETLKALKKDDFSKEIVCSGPYKLLKRVKGKHILLGKNGYYYNKAKVHYDKVNYDIVTDSAVAVKGFLEGKYQDIWPYEVKSMPADFKKNITDIPALSLMTTYLSFNFKKPYVNNIEIRKFIYSKVDVDGFLLAAGLPQHYKAFGYVPLGMLGSRNAPLLNIPDMDEKDLIRNGCTKASPCVVDLIYRFPEEDRLLVVLLKPLEKYKDWLAIKPVRYDMKGWFDRVVSGDYSICMNRIIPDYRDSYMVLRDILNPKYSTPGLDTREIRKLLGKARRENSKAERSVLYSTANDIILEQVSIIPLFHGDRPFRQVLKNITGYNISLFGFYALKMMDITPAKQ